MCGPAALRRTFGAGALAALAALPSTTWGTGQAKGPFNVHAEVSPSAVLKFDFKATAVRVREADLARGYVDINGSSYISLNTGRVVPVVVIDFRPGESVFKSVEVRVENAARAGATSGALPGKPPTPPDMVDEPRERVNALNYRFNLGERARPGVYFVPLTLNIGL